MKETDPLDHHESSRWDSWDDRWLIAAGAQSIPDTEVALYRVPNLCPTMS